MIRILAISLVAVLLAGCADLSHHSKIYRETWAASYDHKELMFFNGGKDMRLVVHGVPGGVTRPGYIDALRTAMIGRNPGQRINFTDNPTGPGADAPTRIVVQSNVAIPVTGRTLCRADGPVETSTAKGPGELVFAYCKRDRELSSLRLRLPAGAKPGDQAFDDAVGLATARLLPLVDPLNSSQSCRVDC